MKKFISFVFVLCLSLFLSVGECLADEIGNELKNNFSKDLKPNIVKNKNTGKDELPNTSNEDIFGDEQAFPFIAGLGKNAAH